MLEKVHPSEAAMDGYTDEVRYRDEVDTVSARPTTIRWAAVFSGAVIGLGLGLLGSMLFLALAFDTGTAEFRDNLSWWLAGTAIVATFLGAFIAGILAGSRGFGAGLAHGMTLWGVLIVGLLAAAIPILSAYGTTFKVDIGTTTYSVTSASYWSAFWTLLIGLGAAAIGGLLGGALPRSARRVERVESHAHRDRVPVTTEQSAPPEPSPAEPIPAGEP
jgi:MFS family permease